eukprot:6352004-Amphidinium_carterae.1
MQTSYGSDHAVAVCCTQAQAGQATRSEVVVQRLWWCAVGGGTCGVRAKGWAMEGVGVDAMGGKRPGGWVRFNNCGGVGAGGCTGVVGRASTDVGCNGL